MEGTVALKWGLVHRGILDHATVRPPLLPLADGAEAEIAAAFAPAGLEQGHRLCVIIRGEVSRSGPPAPPLGARRRAASVNEDFAAPSVALQRRRPP